MTTILFNMTSASFTNYKDLIDYKIMDLSYKLSIQYASGSDSYLFLLYKINLLVIYKELLDNYTLLNPANEETYYNYNFLSPSNMGILSEFAHKILNINYVIDFLDTPNDEWGEIPEFNFPENNQANIAETIYVVL